MAVYFMYAIFFVYLFVFFFFFKQKTAYDMRISDWSSDVCSSDLDRFDYGDVAIVEAVMPRLDRRVGGKHAPLAYAIRVVAQGAFRWPARRVRIPAEQRGGEQGGVALVQMVHFRIEAERAQQSLAADAEHDLLLAPVRVVTAVKAVGERTVHWLVVLVAGVDRQDGDRVADRASEHVKPRSNPHQTTFEPDGDHGVKRCCPVCELPRVGLINLQAVSEIGRAECRGRGDQDG